MPTGVGFYVLFKSKADQHIDFRLLGLVSMDDLHRECGDADRDVFGAVFVRRGVADPFAGAGDHCLSRSHVERTTLVFDTQRPFQHDREFVEGGSLAGLKPSRGAAHVGNAGGGGLGVDAPNVFVDEFGLVAGGLDARGLRDEHWHEK